MIYYYTGAGGIGGNAFVTIQCDLGTNPVADNPADTLTITSGDGSILVTGNAALDEVDIRTAPIVGAWFTTFVPTAGVNAVADGIGDVCTFTSADASTVVTGADNPEVMDWTTNILSWAAITPLFGVPIVPIGFNDPNLTFTNIDGSMTITSVAPAVLSWDVVPGGMEPLLDHSLLTNLTFDTAGHINFQREGEIAVVNPTINNDSADTAGLGHTFRETDTWLNAVTDVLYTCVDASVGAAIWVTQSNFSPTQTIYVAENGLPAPLGDGTKENPFDTVDAGIAAAAALVPAINNKINIIVSAGEYTINNPVVMPGFTTLFAEANDVVVISFNDPNSAGIQIPVAGGAGRYATIQGFWFNCPTNEYAIENTSADVMHVKNCTFYAGAGAIHQLGGGSAQHKIKDCQFWDQTTASLLLAASDQVKLESSFFFEIIGSAIVLSGAHWLKASDLYFMDINGPAIAVSGTSRIDVDTFFVDGGGATNVTLDNSNAWVSNCMLEGGVVGFDINNGARLRLNGGYGAGALATGVLIDNDSHAEIHDYDFTTTTTPLQLVDALSTCNVYETLFDLNACNLNTASHLKGTLINRDGQYNPAQDTYDYERYQIRREMEVGYPEHGHEIGAGRGLPSERGMLVYTFDGGVGYANVTASVLHNGDGLTAQLPNLNPGAAFLVCSTLQDEVTGFTTMHKGFEILQTQGAIIGIGSIVFEFWNGIAWQTFYYMTSNKNPPEETWGEDQLMANANPANYRYDNTLDIAGQWLPNDPMVLGTQYYWIRISVQNAAIGQTPIIDQVKLHYDYEKNNADGYSEYFGFARPQFKMNLRWNDFVDDGQFPLPPSSIALSTNLQQLRANTFPLAEIPEEEPRVCAIILPDKELDTSCPLIFRFKFACDIPPIPGLTDTITWEIHYATAVDQVTVVAVPPAVIPALAVGASVGENVLLPQTNIPAPLVQLTQNVTLYLPTAIFNSLGPGVSDSLWISLKRVAGPQDYLGAAVIEETELFGWKFADGRKNA